MTNCAIAQFKIVQTHRMVSRRCWNCDVTTHMRRVADAVVTGYEEGNPRIDIINAAYRCDECNWLQLAVAKKPRANQTTGLTSSGANSYLDTRAVITWYPVHGSGREFEDVPEHIATAASEAYSCHSIGAYRGAVSLARAVVEATAKAKGITSGNIATKIDKLAEKNLIRAHVQELAHEIRHLGNEAAHGDFVDPIDEVEAGDILTLMSEVLAEVFQSPARLERVRAHREAKRAPGS